ncbi:MAG: flagellar protein FlaG [Planctomycetota bacterium]
MARVDMHLAREAGDQVRPQASSQDRALQAVAATKLEATRADSGATPAPTTDAITAAMAEVQKVLEAATGKRFAFHYQIDERLKEPVVQLTDDNGEVIKQLPSEEVVDLALRIRTLVGALLDKKA